MPAVLANRGPAGRTISLRLISSSLYHNARRLSLREPPRRATAPAGRFARYYTIHPSDYQILSSYFLHRIVKISPISAKSGTLPHPAVFLPRCPAAKKTDRQGLLSCFVFILLRAPIPPKCAPRPPSGRARKDPARPRSRSGSDSPAAAACGRGFGPRPARSRA